MGAFVRHYIYRLYALAALIWWLKFSYNNDIRSGTRICGRECF